MFGWEFPPHISGGLGTACYGLTKSLGNENVDVLFVVPKLHGGERVERVEFVDAGEVKLKRSENKSHTVEKPYSIHHGATERHGESHHITTIEVESDLSPYRLASYETPIESLESWRPAL